MSPAGRIQPPGPKRAKEDCGQGLAYVLVAGAVLLLLVGVLVQVLVDEMKYVVGSSKRSVLLHAADAAIDRAVYALQIGGNWDAIPQGLVAGYQQDVTYTDIPDVRYTIKVQAGNWTPGVQCGDENSERTVTVYARNEKTEERRKIQAVLLLSKLDSAIYSEGQTYVLGSCDIHWGPVVSFSTASDSIPNPQNWLDHPVYFSKGGILLDNKGSATSQGKNCADPIVGQCVCEYCDAVGDPPNIPVDTFRKAALAQNSDGRHYYGPMTSPSSFVCGKFMNPDLPVVITEDDVIFFDSGDGKNYDPETDSICSGTYSGGDDRGAYITFTDKCGKGTLVVMGNVLLSGQGACPATTMVPSADCTKMEADPANCVDTISSDLFWDGFIFVAGELTAQGIQQIYGSMYIYELTADTKGNFGVFFKSNNKSLGYLGKSLLVKLWLERAPAPADIFP